MRCPLRCCGCPSSCLDGFDQEPNIVGASNGVAGRQLVNELAADVATDSLAGTVTVKGTDNSMEEWLKGSFYGRGPKRFSAKQELDALNGVVYAVSVEVEWSGDAWEWRNTEFRDDYDNFKFSISLPNAGAGEMLVIEVSAEVMTSYLKDVLLLPRMWRILPIREVAQVSS